MKRRFSAVFGAVLVSATLAVAGCETGTPAQPNQPGQAALGADGKPVDFTKLAEDVESKYVDLAIDGAGTLHMIYQAQHKKTYKPHVFYRASTDGGANWSAPVDLMEEDTTTQAGFIRLAVDGQGDVYAFWKTYDGFDVVDPSGGENGTLTYRALSGGRWGAPVVLGEPDQVVGFFPAVAPGGRLHVVWSEPLKDGNGYFAPYWEAGRVRQAEITAGVPAAARDILQAPPVQLESSNVFKSNGYRGMSGYIDAQGRAHFVALKAIADATAGSDSTPKEVVYWNGAAETTLMPAARLEAVSQKPTSHPPTLLRDGAGRDHVLVLNQQLERPALLDYDPAAPTTPTTVVQLQNASGNIRGFQAHERAGAIAVTLAMHDTPRADAKHDLVALAYAGGKWGAPVNVTNNAARAEFVSKATSAVTTYSKLETHSALYGAAALDAQGKLNVAFVNTVIEMIMRTTETRAGDGGAYGSNSKTHVFFHKL